jgi:hypothetical protein
MVAVWPEENSFNSSSAGRSNGAPAAGAAGALAVLPALLAAGLVKKVKHESGIILLAFPSDFWTPEYRLKDV